MADPPTTQVPTGFHALPPKPPAPTSAPAPTTAAAPAPLPPASSDQPRPILLVLVGLPGSGKTTFGSALVAQLDGWARFSQDESASGRRQEVEAAVSAALAGGANVIVDRVNFDPAQRAHFVDIARQHGARPRALVLRAPMEVLRARLGARTGHPTLKDADTALRVLGRMKRDLVYPQAHEGFERVLFVDSEGEWGRERIQETLEKLETEGTTGQRPRHGQGRGYAPRGGQPRGGFGGRGFGQPRDGAYVPRGAPRGGYRGGYGRGGYQDGGPRADGYARGGQHGDRPEPYRGHGVPGPSARFGAPGLLPPRPGAAPGAPSGAPQRPTPTPDAARMS